MKYLTCLSKPILVIGLLKGIAYNTQTPLNSTFMFMFCPYNFSIVFSVFHMQSFVGLKTFCSLSFLKINPKLII